MELPGSKQTEGAWPSVCLGLDAQDRMFSMILRKLCRKISVVFSLKPFGPMLYLYHKDVSDTCLFPDTVLHSRPRAL